MQLPTEFIRLPLRFDPERLAFEVNQFPDAAWRAHPQGHPGNTAVPLISAQGDPANDSVKGPMRPTPHLERSPYLRQVLAAFGTVLGRTRLMRIAGQAEATPHVDHNYYWLQRVRIHVPAITFPEVRFLCGGKTVHMAAGESWLFDTWRTHNVLNPTDRPRIHLVADTVGSASFWEMVDQAERPLADGPALPAPAARFVPFELGNELRLETEAVNLPVVMSPWEQQHLLDAFLADLHRAAPTPAEDVQKVLSLLQRFQRHWRHLWACHGTAATGWDAYRQALEQLQKDLAPFANRFRLPNQMEVVEVLHHAIIRPALNADLGPTPPAPAEVVRTATAPEKPRRGPASAPQVFVAPKGNGPAAPASDLTFDRPIFILGAPRSGTSLLFETLARSPTVWTIGGESHGVFERIPQLAPANRGFDSNRLTAADADPATTATLKASFRALLRDARGQRLPAQAASCRLLEKTPKNALRVPFLNQVFPDARFIYLFREPPENLSSIVEAWRSRRFVTYPRLPDWPGPPWSLLLIPGWRQLRGKNLAEIAVAQWLAAQQHILDDLEQLPTARWTVTTYADLVAHPQKQIQRLCDFAGLAWDQELSGLLPLSRHTLTPPAPDKWRVNADLLAPVLPLTETMAARARQVLARRPAPAVSI